MTQSPPDRRRAEVRQHVVPQQRRPDLGIPTLRPASRGLRLVPAAAVALDAVMVTAALVAALVVRDRVDSFSMVRATGDLLMVAPLVVAGWLGCLAVVGSYAKTVFGAGSDEYKRVANGSALAAAVIGVACYLARFELSRGFFVLALLAGPVLLLVGRFAMRRVLKQARRRGHLHHRVLIVGNRRSVDEVNTVLERDDWLGYHAVAAACPGVATGTRTVTGVPVVGDPASVVELAHLTGADIVFLAGGSVENASDLRRISAKLGSSVHVVLAPGITDVAPERVRLRPLAGIPLVHVGKPTSEGAVRGAKRSFDLVGSLLLLLALSPVFAFAALAVKRFDGGPVFFRQTRVGRDGETFGVWKFRTMCIDAEARLAELHRKAGYDGEGLFKMTDDPRITGPGKWLRRFSIDELPQLLNVVTGDMSLVGPRPPLPEEVAQYDDAMLRRLRVRPGMTGLWQVSGRSDLEWAEAVRLDVYYVDNWSMVQDLIILWRTFGAVVRSRGAY